MTTPESFPLTQPSANCVAITISRLASVRDIFVSPDDAPRFVADYLERHDVIQVRCQGEVYAGPLWGDYRKLVTV